MARRLRWLGVLVTAGITAALVGGPTTAWAVQAAQTTVPSAVPSANTPNVLADPSQPDMLADGKVNPNKTQVLALAQVGDVIVAGGIVTQVQDAAANGGSTYARSQVFAFDAATGKVLPGFAPTVSGEVDAVTAGPGGTVYIGGQFNTVNGQTRKKIAQLNLSDGSLTGFKVSGIDGAINDLELFGGRLYLAGNFTVVNGVPHGGLATVDPTTGATDEYLGVDVAGHHNYNGSSGAQSAVGVARIDITPDGSRMVAIGNFKTADSLARDQLAVLQLQPAGVAVDPNWATASYSPACNSKSFDSYVRDLSVSPDGSYFVVGATGGPYTGTLCDAAARFDFATIGTSVQPTWVSATGGDTIFSVAVTDAAVYIGGHFRWLNNPSGRDSAAQGAVPRPGLGALSTLNGLPLTWNPGRNPRGIGAQALLATDTALYVGSDTDYIGNRQYLRGRLAAFPLAGGAATAAETALTLPANVYLAGRASGSIGVDDVVSRWYDGTTAGPDHVLADTGFDFSKVRGSFWADGRLFYGYPDATGTYYLWHRTFDGQTFGTPVQLNPYQDPTWSSVQTGSGQTYQGVKPTFYTTELSRVTGMFYSNGRIYFVRNNSSAMYSRAFSLDSGIVGSAETTAVPSGISGVSGMFLSGDTLYLASSLNGSLSRASWVNGTVSGGRTQLTDGKDWRGAALFVGPGTNPDAPNVAPEAVATSASSALFAEFDGSTSSDSDGTVVSYDWQFGDGATATGPSASHTYGAAGTYTATLTVTDDEGASSSATTRVTVTAGGIAFRDAASTTNNRGTTSVSLTVPASAQARDGLVLVLSTNSTVTGTAPDGWTLVGTQSASPSLTTQVFSRVATATDAGTAVTVQLSGTAKVTAQLLAYAGTSKKGPIASLAGASDVAGTAHTTPQVAAPADGYVVSVWADKSSSARTFTAPAGVTTRVNAAGVGNGDVATLVADPGHPVPAGSEGHLTATVGTASNRATMLTVVLATEVNAAPVAAATSACTALSCTFDAAGSVDPDGSVVSYDWAFGDGTTASGETVAHTFAAGTYPVTLTVTDDQGSTGTSTSQVTVAPAAGIAFRDSVAATSKGAASVAVTVPASVRSGDGMVLVLSTNGTTPAEAPNGWAQVGVQAASPSVTTQVFQRLATSADAGSTVTVALSGSPKASLQLAAYSGTAATPVTSVTGAGDVGGTAHTTPQATAGDGSWVLSAWSDKQGVARAWVAPDATELRSSVAGSGNGDVASLLVDGGAPVAAGTVGGLTATVPTPSNRATMLTIVLGPAS
jgi:PKD repeat protein